MVDGRSIVSTSLTALLVAPCGRLLVGIAHWSTSVALLHASIDLPYIIFAPERWMGLRVQSTVGRFPELCFLQFSVAQVLVGLRKQIYKQFFFLLWPVLLVLIIIIIIILVVN